MYIKRFFAALLAMFVHVLLLAFSLLATACVIVSIGVGKVWRNSGAITGTAYTVFDVAQQLFFSENNRYYLYAFTFGVVGLFWTLGYSLITLIIVGLLCMTVPLLVVASLFVLFLGVVFGVPVWQ